MGFNSAFNDVFTLTLGVPKFLRHILTDISAPNLGSLCLNTLEKLRAQHH